MTFTEFDKYQEELLKQVVVMKDTKGKEYANSEDRFANFNRLAESLGLTNIQVGWVYTAKHLDAIAQFCRTQQTHSTEGIEGRIIDAITYLTLIGGMIAEEQKKSKDKDVYCQLCHTHISNISTVKCINFDNKHEFVPIAGKKYEQTNNLHMR